MLEATADITIEELRRSLVDKEAVGYETARRFFARHAITRKKTAHAVEKGTYDK